MTFDKIAQRETPVPETKETAVQPVQVSGPAFDAPDLSMSEGECYYEGQRYSQGAKVRFPDDRIYTCRDGSWGI
jgi:hypothetical protein